MADLKAPRPTGSSLADRYRVLLDVGRTLTATRSLEDLYRAIYRETARVLEADGFYISLHDPVSDEATIVFFADRGKEQRVEVRYRGSESSVIRTGQAVRIDDRLEQKSLMLLGGASQGVTRSAISAPLRWKDGILGAISTQSYSPGAFTDADVELLQGLADMAAVAIENARHVALLQRRTAEARQIEEIGRAITGSLDPAEVMAKVMEATVSLLESDGATVWMLGPGTIARVHASAGTVTLPTGLEWDLAGPLFEELVTSRNTVRIGDLAASTLVPDRVRGQLSRGSGIGCPLVVGGSVAGVLSAGDAEKEAFDDEDTAVLERLASQASVALENARLHQSLQALSLTDPLTGLPNRRHLEVHLEREVAAARRGRELMAVIFDLDHFKVFNDRHGHLAGDEALRAFARILADENRAMNLVARYGGDEFVSILSETSGEGADLYISRVRARMSRDPLLGPSGISAACGVAEFEENMQDGEDLIDAADRQLYREKARRNEVADAASGN